MNAKYVRLIFSLFIIIIIAACSGSGGGGSGGGGGGDDRIANLPDMVGVWQGTMTSSNPGSGAWCAEMSQVRGTTNILGNFYRVSGQNICGTVKDPAERPIAGATVYIPNPGGSYPDISYFFTGGFDLDRIEFTADGQIMSLELSGDLDVDTMTATNGSYDIYDDQQIHLEQGTWEGAKNAGATACLPCEPPIEPYLTYACTNEDGEFLLDTSSVQGNMADIKAFKVAYQGMEQGVLLDGTDLRLDADGCLPITVTAKKIAVVTGRYDRVEDLLAKLGMGSLDADGKLDLERPFGFDLYDGVDLIAAEGELDDADYPDFNELIEGHTRDVDENGDPLFKDLSYYDVVFLNCQDRSDRGHTFVLPSASWMSKLRQYVRDGGSLYVTDLSYDFIEQAFSEHEDGYDDILDYIDFLGADLTVNAAEEGENFWITDGTINDVQLLQWLQSEFVTCEGGSCLTDDKVHLDAFDTKWAVIDSVDTAAPSPMQVLVEGPVKWTGQADPVIKPLTVMFTYGSGTVTFTSYHTHEEVTSEELRPEERILQYLVFYLIGAAQSE